MRCQKETTTSPSQISLKPLTRPTRSRAQQSTAAPATATVESSATNNSLGGINQNELLSRFNKIKCGRLPKTETPKSFLDDNASPGPSGISTKNATSNENTAKKIQSNKISSAPSNPLFDQKTPVAKQNSPAAEVPASSSGRPLNRPPDRRGANATMPIAQNGQGHNE